MTIDFAAVSDQLARDGVAVVEGVLSPDEAAAALDGAVGGGARERRSRRAGAHRGARPQRPPTSGCST